MKKLLTLLSLTMAMTTFAAPHGNEEKSATMNITATVIRPLTVEVVDHMNFGTVIQGNKVTATGKYLINGEPGQKITVTTTFPENLFNVVSRSTLPIELNMPMPLTGYALGTDGELPLNIYGSITPSTETAPGTYKGQIIARVQYQ
ncbi:hypothetical protein NON08_07050 [Cetobacterium somerae]|uniref:hypothetical protein n=1 Tax=Cetobacterium sp. NK01 TaxID=2993530 RepID=UPI00211678C9|nr:hypothetical protein [Cetobacterium sp. NK01]MCQ8212278.1 hypothetical protein [Cetobacterium sp. NK01]